MIRTFTVLSVDSDDDDKWPEKLVPFIEWLQEALNSEFRRRIGIVPT